MSILLQQRWKTVEPNNNCKWILQWWFSAALGSKSSARFVRERNRARYVHLFWNRVQVNRLRQFWIVYWPNHFSRFRINPWLPRTFITCQANSTSKVARAKIRQSIFIRRQVPQPGTPNVIWRFPNAQRCGKIHANNWQESGLVRVLFGIPSGLIRVSLGKGEQDPNKTWTRPEQDTEKTQREDCMLERVFVPYIPKLLGDMSYPRSREISLIEISVKVIFTYLCRPSKRDSLDRRQQIDWSLRLLQMLEQSVVSYRRWLQVPICFP